MTHHWIWIDEPETLVFHEEQLAEHGGGAGIRDISLLQSALSRPRNLAAYDNPDPAALAASYAFGIARNHPFVDGNKRTALVVAETFLNLNGWELNADNAEVTALVMELAAGNLNAKDKTEERGGGKGSGSKGRYRGWRI